MLSIKRKGAKRTHGEDVPESTGRTARAVGSVELRSSLATESLTLLLLLLAVVAVVVASGKLLGEVDKVIHFCVCVWAMRIDLIRSEIQRAGSSKSHPSAYGLFKWK